jgi:hypothetical protein
VYSLRSRTIRVRLALLCFVVFLASGVAMLAVTLAVWQSTTPAGTVHAPTETPSRVQPSRHSPGASSGQTPSRPAPSAQHRTDRHQLLIASGIALATMAGLSLLIGRFLRPVRTITRSTREISATNLHERLNLPGPDDELKELGDTFDELLARLKRSLSSSAGSLPTPRTSCAAHSRRCERRSMSRWPSPGQSDHRSPCSPTACATSSTRSTGC